MSGDGADLRPLDATLVRVVLLMRTLGWVWLIVLGVVTLVTGPDDVDQTLVAVSMVVATAGTAITFLAARRGFLGNPVYVALDGVVAIGLAMVGPLAGVGDFIAGGYPASWLFVVAYAFDMRVTTVAGFVAGLLYAAMHVFMELGVTRAYGSVQFLVIAVVVGWGFDALRRQDRLRVAAETERAEAQAELADEQTRVARLEERTAIAVRLHDSVLQTLRLIRSSADEASEVRYLARVQERDLRRTISEYESRFPHSFRSRMLDACYDVEDMYRVEVTAVIKDDAELDDALETAIEVTRDVMALAVRDDGAEEVDLYAELRDGTVQVSIRTFPTKGDADVISAHLRKDLEDVGGTVSVGPAPGNSRNTTIEVSR